MDHFDRIRQHLAHFDLDAILLTEEANRFYATGFHSTGSDGAALITKNSTWYFTDARYIEAAEKTVFLSDSGDNTTAGAAGDNAYMINRLHV